MVRQPICNQQNISDWLEKVGHVPRPMYDEQNVSDWLEKIVHVPQPMYDEQNVSDWLKKGTHFWGDLLHSVESDFDLLKALDQKHVVDVKNQTDIIREMLTSEEVSATCMVNDTAETNKVTICHR
ncbi:hypothetical protein RRG08_026902 [Elysia crispata]|uniref:Uncharacterized protein n=1 Tax=Elysia crispata TaxID=231223 RepID=A0AAE1AW39_9GAST|nr:hypothetical protein RRG08_026902 [Elysia crispata]